MNQRTVQLSRVVAMFLVPIIATSCASSDQQQAVKAQMEQAQAAYQQAKADPNVQTYAQLRLADAEKALLAAERAKDLDEKLHLGYLAERKAQLASVTGATSRTEQNIQQFGREVSDVLLQMRNRELKAARAGTETRNSDGEQARRAAEARARDAEMKLREAEAKTREAEQARRQAALAETQARAAEEAKATLASELASLKAQHTDRGLVLTVGDVLFAAGKAEVGPGALRGIDKLADFLKAYPKRNVLIEGHTDNTGDEDFNVKLSQQRADAVRDMLVAKGIAAERVRTKGYGPKLPVVANDTPAGRQQNRRVEVVILNEGASADGSAR